MLANIKDRDKYLEEVDCQSWSNVCTRSRNSGDFSKLQEETLTKEEIALDKGFFQSGMRIPVIITRKGLVLEESIEPFTIEEANPFQKCME